MKIPCLLLSFALTACAHSGAAGGPRATVWKLDNVASVGGFQPEVWGSPRAVVENGRRALCFDGQDDGLLLPTNPIAGLARFTIEILFRPDGDGPAEQRFLHIQDERERRVLIETRVTDQRTFALDTFLRDTDANKLTLLDRTLVQPTDRWHWAALVYDGATMSHYVDAAKQLSGAVIFPPMDAGRMSLGVRQNRVHWFKGCIAQVRVTAAALPATDLQRPN
jgi:hypothetical protein